MKILSNKIMYIGVDVHKESWQVTARTDGEEIFNERIPAAYHSLLKLLERFKNCQVKVAYEAGPCGFSLHDKLMEDGIDTIVVPPSLIPIESGNRLKTDKRDSRKLARFLESNMPKKVFVLTEETREDFESLRLSPDIFAQNVDPDIFFKYLDRFAKKSLTLRATKLWKFMQNA